MSWIDQLISDEIAEDDQLAVKAKLFVKITCIFSVVGVLYATLYATSMDFIEGARFLYTMAVINALGIALFYKSQNVALAGNYLGLMLFSAFVFLTYTSGGLYSSANAWFGIMVLVTLLISGKKSGLTWGVVAFLYIIGLFVLTQSGHDFPSLYADGTDAPRQLIGFGGGVILISILALIFESNKVRAYEELDYTLNNTVSDLEEAKAEIYSSASETAERAGECVDYSDRISAQLNEVSKSISEMKSNIQSISSRAEKSVSTVDQALSLSKNSYKRIDTLKDRSDEIGKIVGIIRSITTQINLLALNAGVEAVRAGEAGGSFSVVADEIKNLASRTTESTDTIEHTVTAIQAEVDHFIRDLDDLGKIMSNVSTNQSEIQSAVDIQASTTSVMADSISESANQGKRVAKLINQLADSASDLIIRTRQE